MTTPKCGSNLVSPPSFGRGLGPCLCFNRPCRVVSASPGVTHQAVLSRSRLAAIPGASATKSPHPSTVRRGRQLSSIKSAPAASSTFAFLTKPSLPTTIHSTLPLASTFFLLWHSHSRAVLSARFFACPSPRNTSFNPHLDIRSRNSLQRQPASFPNPFLPQT